METLLVTGGAGFIGSNYIKYIFKTNKNVKIINLDVLTYAGNIDNLKEVEDNPLYQFIKGDICDTILLDEIFKNNDIDSVVNFAAETHVDRSIENPESFVKTNVLGTYNLLETIRRYWEKDIGINTEKKYVQISTDEVYGSLGNEGYFTEESPIDPHSPYSASKAGADHLVKAYFDTYKMPCLITRCSNNYGPNQYPEKLIPLMIKKALKKESLPVYGDGKNIRDWLYVEDHCSAIELVRKSGTIGEVYNIGGSNEKNNNEIVKIIISYLNKNVNNTITEDIITYVEDRKGHDRRYAIDASKIRRELDWKPNTTFDEGIKKTIDWYIESFKEQ